MFFDARSWFGTRIQDPLVRYLPFETPGLGGMLHMYVPVGI